MPIYEYRGLALNVSELDSEYKVISMRRWSIALW